jgi:hypothetical protein
VRQVSGAYRSAPGFEQTLPLVERICGHADRNLFGFLHHSIVETCRHLGLETEIAISSGFAIDHGLKAQDKVLALCQASGASTYVNAIGGTSCIRRTRFVSGARSPFVSRDLSNIISSARPSCRGFPYST